MNRDLALMFAAEKAPDEIKAAGQALLERHFELEKCKDQAKKWARLREDAQKIYNAETLKFSEMIEKWVAAFSPEEIQR